MNNRIIILAIAFIVDCICWFLLGCFLISLCLADGASVRDTFIFINIIDFTEEERENNMSRYIDGTFNAWKSSSTYYCKRDETFRKANNDFVIKCWEQGVKAENQGDTLTTDGKTVFSYGNPIGWTNSRGDRILANYRASSASHRYSTWWYCDWRGGQASPHIKDVGTDEGHFVSVTTSIHVGRAMQVANYIYNPVLAVEMAQC
jgi:hypothetical protein